SGRERARADQSQLFTRPERDEHVALPGLPRQDRRRRQYRRRARRVVVGAVVNLVRLVLARQRVAGLAVTEMLVGRADRTPRLGDRAGRLGGRQIREDVVAGLLLALHRGADVDGDARNGEAGDVRVTGIERLLCFFKRLAGAAENLRADAAADADRD